MPCPREKAIRSEIPSGTPAGVSRARGIPALGVGNRRKGCPSVCGNGMFGPVHSDYRSPVRSLSANPLRRRGASWRRESLQRFKDSNELRRRGSKIMIPLPSRKQADGSSGSKPGEFRILLVGGDAISLLDDYSKPVVLSKFCFPRGRT